MIFRHRCQREIVGLQTLLVGPALLVLNYLVVDDGQAPLARNGFNEAGQQMHPRFEGFTIIAGMAP